jgi:chromosomal replication initiator protein
MKINPDIIVEKVALYYSQEVSELQCSYRCRDGELVKTRQVTMFFLREMTNMSLANIGRIYTKDHATVLHSCKQVQNQYDTNIIYKQEIDELRAIILKYQRFQTRISLHYDLMALFGKKLAPHYV